MLNIDIYFCPLFLLSRYSQLLTFFLNLKAAKRHLTQRIQRLDDKLDKQKEMSGQIRDEVLPKFLL